MKVININDSLYRITNAEYGTLKECLDHIDDISKESFGSKDILLIAWKGLLYHRVRNISLKRKKISKGHKVFSSFKII